MDQKETDECTVKEAACFLQLSNKKPPKSDIDIIETVVLHLNAVIQFMLS